MSPKLNSSRHGLFASMTHIMKYKVPLSILAVALAGGIGAGATSLVSAQTANPATTTVTTNAGEGTGGIGGMFKGHAPLGNDGIVSSVTGTTIVMNEEADEGGASYTVDASGATYTKDGTAATIADIKVGDKIFVKGAVTGNSVIATGISLGHPEGGGHRGRGPKDGTDSVGESK